jgi:carboxymethylenebutenolidase
MQSESTELGYWVGPEGDASAVRSTPQLVVIHDVWGLSDHTRDIAERLGRDGFGVLAIDLYRRESQPKIEDPGSWMRALSDPQVLADVEAGVRFLHGLPGAGRVGVVGFCMGGMYALLAGCGVAGVEAVVPFYGILSHQHGLLAQDGGLDARLKPREPLQAARDLRCPMLAFFGDEDPYVTRDDVETLGAVVAAGAQDAEIVTYPSTGHAFMNDTRPDAYRPEAAADAWRRMVEFLRFRLS